jgi:hypothetical protein
MNMMRLWIRHFRQDIITRCHLLIWDIPIKISKDINPIRVLRQRIRALNRKYEGFFLKKACGINLKTRKVCHGKFPSEYAFDSVDLTGGIDDV